MLDFVLLVLMITMPIFWLRIIKKKSWDKIKQELIPIKKNPFVELVGGVKLFFALLIGFLLLSMVFNLSGINDLEKVSEVIAINSQNITLYLIVIIIMVFVEELFFRSFLVKQIGLIPSSIIFGIAHIGYYSIAQVIGAFALGLMLAYWFKQNNSITQNYLGHLLYNLFAIILYILSG
ncbi:MAG: CPBP family intramembrane glutamic endopeptidase [archaeon]|jgi:membrane protease YdiL (CAAX protease family)